jgi:murein DD-endopeptidase MepM/ murein hydrolase activator NlpD
MRALLAFLLGVVVGAGGLYYATRHGIVLHPREIADAVRVTKAPSATTRAPAPDATIPAPPATRSVAPIASTSTIAPPPAPASTPVPPTATPLPTGATLAMPLASIKPGQLVDTFNDLRGGDRRHEALDIPAPAGTPVLAVADGHIEKLFTSVPGGLTIYQFEPRGRYAYYYAHLQSYAPGLAEKQQVRRGQVIGYVGSTGNASPEAPHLHFAVFELGPEKRWWQGTATDPYPLLTGHPPLLR